MKSSMYGLLLLICITSLEFMQAEDNEGSSVMKRYSSSGLSEYNSDDDGYFDIMEDKEHGSESWQRRMRRNCKPGLWCKRKGLGRAKY